MVRLYTELPILGTKNLVWVFVNVGVKTGWIRIIILAYALLGALITVIMCIFIYPLLIRIAFSAWTHGEKQGEKVLEEYLRRVYEANKAAFERGKKVPV